MLGLSFICIFCQLPPIPQAAVDAPSVTVFELFKWKGIEEELGLTEKQAGIRKSLERNAAELKNTSLASIEYSLLCDDFVKSLKPNQRKRLRQLQFQLNVALKRDFTALRKAGIDVNRAESEMLRDELLILPIDIAFSNHEVAWNVSWKLLSKHTSDDDAKKLMGEPFVFNKDLRQRLRDEKK